jgi:2-keto-4-pentenoate hydratase/2-oxohepta-3-ene-1,7-dioic acid hydratase in catechol pathway
LKLVRFELGGKERLGALEGELIVDLVLAHKLYLRERPDRGKKAPRTFPQTIIGFLKLGEDVKKYTYELLEHVRGLLGKRSRQLERQKALLPLSDMQVLPPVPIPPKIICLGLNYRDHAEEARVPIPERPILFSKPSTAIVGPEDPIVYPKISTQVDYEIELAAVIGKTGRNVSELGAFDHVAGYTVFNDVSARDIQFGDKQWFRGKSFDTFAPTGPCLVLSDQVRDPHRLKMELRVNGEIRQSSTTANMIFKIPQLVAFISRVMTLQVGDIIATGTPAGVGFYAKPEKKLLKPGDLIEAEIEGIGVLRNKVVRER